MQQLDPKSVWLFFSSFILRWLIVIIPLSIWGLAFWNNVSEDPYAESDFSFGFLNWLWLIVPSLILLCFIWAKLTYRFYYYELTEDGFRKELGVVYKKYVTIPYNRIQNVDIYRGVLARILGLSDLNIQTAGASATVNRYGAVGIGAEGRLPGLSREVAEQLRDELIRRASHSKGQGL